MSLLKDFTDERNKYLDHLQQIAEQFEAWYDEVSKEKRLGLKPMDQIVAEADPYNNQAAANPAAPKGDTVEFTPTPGVEKPTQTPGQKPGGMSRLHIVFDPQSGRIEKLFKTPMLSRPPAEYMEANAEQIQNAMHHLEKLNPKLADALVRGKMSVWIPRSAGQAGPSSVKHLGLTSTGHGGGVNRKEMSSQDLASARAAADKMKMAG